MGPWQKYQQQGASAALGRPVIREAAPQPPRKHPLDEEAARLGIQNARGQIEERRQKKADSENKFRSQIDSATSDIMRVVNRLDRVALDANDNDGWGETGRSGSFMRSMPSWVSKGSAGYDLQRDLDLVGANAAIESLMQMRRESPTGAGVGNVALGELQIMKDKFATLDPDQGHDSFLRNVAEGKREFLDKLRKINPRAYKQYLESNPVGIWPKKDGSFALGKLGGGQARPAPRTEGLPQGWSIEED